MRQWFQLSRVWPWPLLASPTPSASFTPTLCTMLFCSYTPLSCCCKHSTLQLRFPYYSHLQACCYRAYLYVNK